MYLTSELSTARTGIAWHDEGIMPAHTQIAPVIFVGHGNPMNAIEENGWAVAWKALGRTLPRPNVICVISAHWLTRGTFVHVGKKPRTIHDFGGFPEELFRVTYEAPGAPAIAEEALALLAEFGARPDTSWGLDHGAWSVLARLFPDADIPVFQISLDITKNGAGHARIASALSALRDKNILILGSGNIVHNLSDMSWEPDVRPRAYATSFDERVAGLIQKRDLDALCDYATLDIDAAMAVPTPDHYWPLISMLALTRESDVITFPVTGIAHGSISMRAVMAK